MARLSAKTRRSEPSSDFGLPKQRKYPMPDRAHAANAKARASEMEHEGRITSAQEAQIDRKANHILGSGAGDADHRRQFHHGVTRHNGA